MFIPLHLHTEYSFLDGKITPKKLVKYCKENNLPGAAITDHGNMCGVMDFKKEFDKAGLKLVIGCEFYVYHGDFTQMRADNIRDGYHLILLAKDLTGYYNLIKLHNIAHSEGYYYKPKINLEALKTYSEGLICMSACLGGDIQQAILNDDINLASKLIDMYSNLFKDDFYVEFQDHGIPEQAKVNPILMDLSKKMKLQPVITTDAHYVYKEEREAHDILLCMNTGKDYNDPNRFKFTWDAHLSDRKELTEKFSSWMDSNFINTSLDNTVNIFNKCDVKFPKPEYQIPEFEVPDGFSSEIEYLRKLTDNGLKRRYGTLTKEIIDRAVYELSVVEKMGFAGYFLIVADFVNWSKDNKIAVGVGRGSAGGSIVAYATGITDIDPMRFGLLFERFLNPDRISMPDIDIDFDPTKRGNVIKYVQDKYGKDKVCQIATFGTLSIKAALKSVARTYSIPYADQEALVSAVPDSAKSISEALETSKELQMLYKEELIQKVVDIAIDLEDMKANYGLHAAGVVISKKPLNEVIPLMKPKEKDKKEAGGLDLLATAYSMKYVEDLGLLKMDFLGLRNLAIIDETCNILEEEGIHINPVELIHTKMDDEKTYIMLQQGLSSGVFQVESDIMKKLLREIKPENIDDISAINSLARPGCLNSGLTASYIEMRQTGNIEKPHYITPALEPLMKGTLFLPIYQENCMQMAVHLAKYTLAQSDDLRKAIGKKDADKMGQHHEKFVNGCIENEFNKDFGEEVFAIIDKFSSYGFNASHSYAYSCITYQTAYLKANYSKEYMTALLNSVKSDQDSLKVYLDECYKLGVILLPPDINESRKNFTSTSEGIRFGLSAIKNLGEKVVEKIIKERKKGKFTSLINFVERCPTVDSRALENLCKVNAFVTIENNAKKCLIMLEAITKGRDRIKAILNTKSQVGFEKLGGKTLTDAVNYYIKDLKLNLNTIDFKDSERELYEKELLGFFVSSHPLIRIQAIDKYLTTHNITEIIDLPNVTPKEKWIESTYKGEIKLAYDSQVTFIGIIKTCKLHTTAGGKPMAFLTVESIDSSIDVTVFNNAFSSHKVKEGNVILIKGKPQQQPDNSFCQYGVIADFISVVDFDKFTYIDMNDKSLEEIETFQERLSLNTKEIGFNPVVLLYKDSKILTHKKYWVKDPSELNYLIG